jgi:predicted secreted protein
VTQPVPAVDEVHLAGGQHEPITLPIAEGPATGYEWQLDLPEGVRRIDDGPPRTPEPGTAVGGAVSGYLRVEVDRPGDFIVTARLARPWELDQPIRIVRIMITVTS